VLGTGAGNRGLVWCWLGVLVTVGISGMGKVVAAIAAQYGCAHTRVGDLVPSKVSSMTTPPGRSRPRGH
jgi:hypothetical protein